MLSNAISQTTGAILPDCMSGHLLDPQLLEVETSDQTKNLVAGDLNFGMQLQQQTNWCWSAAAVSVGNYYYGPGSFTQCAVASDALNSNCCNQPGPCNVYGYLDRALKITRSFAGVANGSLTLERINTEINQGKPTGVRCAWYGGGAHFLMIYGVNGIYLSVADSIYGYSTQAFNSFPSSYNGGGTWTTTYFTARQ